MEKKMKADKEYEMVTIDGQIEQGFDQKFLKDL